MEGIETLDAEQRRAFDKSLRQMIQRERQLLTELGIDPHLSCAGDRLAITHKPHNPARGEGVPKETGSGLKRERQRRDDRPDIGAKPAAFRAPWCEPVHKHGPGIVGDSGERSDAHPV